MKKTFRANLYFLVILLGEIIAPFFLINIYNAIGISDIRLQLFLNHMVLFILPAILYVLIVKPDIKQTFKLNKLHLKDFFLIIALSVLCQPLVTLFSLITSFFFENDIANFVSEISSTSFIVMLLLMAVMPAITEEITLRGIVQAGYDDKSDFKTCIVIGLFFGIFHLNGQQFLYAAVLGGILAYLVRITNSIFASMTFHFMINGTSVVMQKVLTFVNAKFGIQESAEQIAIKSLSIKEKLVLLGEYSIIGLISGILTILLLKKIKKINDQRKEGFSNNILACNGISYKEYISYDNKNIVVKDKAYDKIINWPLVVTIVIYLIYMSIEIYARYILVK
ncbi:CPBP family intramembrane glutamic endopeptidase [Clostridium weizhouense]|uniref:CPBP family intramembrane metalloprotease n=1 Tax=Clostridium weizhouense TaxID=2859781 RepID=A0ABS7AS83_9CLOT|nr:type II CAAX endopeptidase family protein [Clostridium weizhouense]MBW6411477.1 CPBP family intramembrane metalloprotease [Clostridium weizhouense]